MSKSEDLRRKKNYDILIIKQTKHTRWQHNVTTNAWSVLSLRLKKLHRINQRKGHWLHSGIQWRWGRSGRWFHYTLYLSRFPYPSVFTTAERPCWSLCADLWAFSKGIGKVPVSGELRFKSKISEKMLSKPWYAHPMLKICVALNKEKNIASFRNPVTIRTIWTMNWYFRIADFCIGLLVFTNNRGFTQRNRVYGHFCWKYFWEILSYRQREFWRMWNPQNRLFHITDKTLMKAIVNISVSWYNLLGSWKSFRKKNVHDDTCRFSESSITSLFLKIILLSS